jgi:tryptophan-rich sensory protein
MKKIPIFITSIVLCQLAGVIGAVFTTPSIPTWYAGLTKGPLNPPSWVFGPVWTILYLLMGISLYLVWSRDWKVAHQLLSKKRAAWNRWSDELWRGKLQTFNIVGVFAVQYLLNILWSIIFFSWHEPMLAFYALIAMWVAILYTMVNFYRVSKRAAWLLLPYLLWVSFAGYLNYTVWILN